MKKIYLLILAGIVAGVGISLFFKEPEKSSGQIEKAVTAPAPVASQIPVGNPSRIKISKLSVDAEVESVSVDNQGNMDIPSNYNNTAWYNLGPKPGEKGSAVIDGHVDTPQGDPSVFAKISTLSEGDEVEITDEGGKKYKFTVVKIETYDLEKMPLTQIFSKNTPAMLNLITCAGTFDKASKMYDKRTVVYSSLSSQY